MTFSPIMGARNSNGFVGMFECERVKQKLKNNLQKGKFYNLFVKVRTIPQNCLILPDDIEFSNNIDGNGLLQVKFSKGNPLYIINSCATIDQEDINLNIANISNIDYPPGNWIQLSTGSFLCNSNYDWFSIELVDASTDYYILIDDIVIIENCETGCELDGCSIIDGPIQPQLINMFYGESPAGGTQKFPIKISNLHNVDKVEFFYRLRLGN